MTFDKSAMHELAVADSLVPVRPGEPGTRPFWNAHSKCLTFAPAFNFEAQFSDVPTMQDYTDAPARETGRILTRGNGPL